MDTAKNEELKAPIEETKVPFENEVYVYLKNTKVIQAIGVMSSDDVFLTFTSGDFVTTFRKEDIAVVIRDLEPGEEETFKTNEKMSGFELYSQTGTSLGFNGWNLGDDVYLSKDMDLIVFYEPVSYEKKGPEQEPVTPKVKKGK